MEAAVRVALAPPARWLMSATQLMQGASDLGARLGSRLLAGSHEIGEGIHGHSAEPADLDRADLAGREKLEQETAADPEAMRGLDDCQKDLVVLLDVDGDDLAILPSTAPPRLRCWKHYPRGGGHSAAPLSRLRDHAPLTPGTTR